MMMALISGSAAKAVFVQGSAVRFIEADDLTTVRTSTLADIPYLLAGADDVVKMQVKDYSESHPILISGWRKDRALRMLQILLTPDDDEELLEACACFDALLATEEVRRFVESTVYAVPYEGARSFMGFDVIKPFQRANLFVQQLIDDQPRIQIVRNEFDKIRFATNKQKYEYEERALRHSVFFQVVKALSGEVTHDQASFACLSAFAGLSNARLNVQFWMSPLISRPARRRLKLLDQVNFEGEREENWSSETNIDARTARAQLDRVIREKDAIVQQLHSGDYATARQFATHLIDWQIQKRETKFAVKTLCALATIARHMGLHDLELEWALHAIEVRPEDAFAHGLLADTYMSLYRFQEAQIEFQKAISFGDIAFGKVGMARVLRASGQLASALDAFADIRGKFGPTAADIAAWVGYCETLHDMWRLEEALRAFEEAQRIYPTESRLFLGYAGVLQDFGQVDEAISVYSDAIRNWPDEPRGYCGRAGAMRLKGDFALAIKFFSEAETLFPETPYPLIGLAETYRASGEFASAQTLYTTVVEKFPFEPSGYIGRADTLRDDREYEAALDAYRFSIAKFPLEPRARNGFANALKLTGAYVEALQAFDQNVRDFPYDLYALSGQANLLKLLGKYDDAIVAYERIVDRRPEFISAAASKCAILIAMGRMSEVESMLPQSAPHSESEWLFYHVRGMYELKTGNVNKAIDIFSDGLNRSPYHRLRDSFRSALAVAKIRVRNFVEADRILRNADSSLDRVLFSVSQWLQGNNRMAETVLDAVNDNIAPKLFDLKTKIMENVKLQHTIAPGWLIDNSEEAVLQMAA